jgi:KUP system potassium uptake protein
LAGEGGVFALLQGLYPRPEAEEDDRTLTTDTDGEKGHDYARGRTFLRLARWPLTFWALFGTSLTLSDGVLTPGMECNFPHIETRAKEYSAS